MRKSALVTVALCVAASTSGSAVFGQTNSSPITEARSVCVPYDPAKLIIIERGLGYWELQRGDGAVFKNFVDKQDAEEGLAVAKENNQLCYIGKGNTRPNRKDFIMEYWRKR